MAVAGVLAVVFLVLGSIVTRWKEKWSDTQHTEKLFAHMDVPYAISVQLT
jgi:hypothetical protein